METGWWWRIPGCSRGSVEEQAYPVTLMVSLSNHEVGRPLKRGARSLALRQACLFVLVYLGCAGAGMAVPAPVADRRPFDRLVG